MKEIGKLLRRRNEIENVRRSLFSLLDGTLDILQRIASDHGPGNRLYRAIRDYDLTCKISRKFLSEEQLKAIEKRYGEIQKIWAPGY
jgi:hypothetical protein|tara:strand:- start:835 stop:1095 length:261 start_codon:yes stop_codon:yes gene_type:complete